VDQKDEASIDATVSLATSSLLPALSNYIQNRFPTPRTPPDHMTNVVRRHSDGVHAHDFDTAVAGTSGIFFARVYVKCVCGNI